MVWAPAAGAPPVEERAPALRDSWSQVGQKGPTTGAALPGPLDDGGPPMVGGREQVPPSFLPEGSTNASSLKINDVDARPPRPPGFQSAPASRAERRSGQGGGGG